MLGWSKSIIFRSPALEFHGHLATPLGEACTLPALTTRRCRWCPLTFRLVFRAKTTSCSLILLSLWFRSAVLLLVDVVPVAVTGRGRDGREEGGRARGPPVQAALAGRRAWCATGGFGPVRV